MSSVRKKDQSEHRFSVLDVILNMYEHTTTVTANPKIFDRTYSSLINRINDEAAMIYHCCRCANEDYDNRKQDEAKIRIQLQKEAIEHCKWLKTNIRLAEKRFHIRAGKITYWNSLVNKAMDSIKSWNQSEIRNYRENYGL